MSDINNLDREAKEYFYSLPLATQRLIKESNVEITCQQDIQRYFTNVISNAASNVNTDKPVF